MKKLVVNNELEVVDDILIVKVGSNTLISKEDVKRGEINQKSFDVIGDQLKRQRELGRKIIVVSSAAISAGMIETGTKIRPDKEIKENLPELQRLAASGWRTITNLWDDTLSPINTSNILFTRRELEFKKRERSFLM
jgi:glutamate 5-kinase